VIRIRLLITEYWDNPYAANGKLTVPRGSQGWARLRYLPAGISSGLYVKWDCDPDKDQPGIERAIYDDYQIVNGLDEVFEWLET
jgi:hypothetical protein